MSKLRIATYNTWNSEQGGLGRPRQLLHEILRIDADVIGLQEVTSSFFEQLGSQAGIPAHRIFHTYAGEDEGLAFLSRYPIIESCFLHERPESCAALHALLDTPIGKISVTNVHLPWDSCKERERQAVTIQAFIARQEAVQYFLLGDFNADAGDSVDRFLRGQQTLCDAEASPCWCDLGRAMAARAGKAPDWTLDTLSNPRWKGQKTIYAPCVMDRIYLRDTWAPVKLEDAFIFGCEISQETGFAPSDHYGVEADIDL